jgi:hypothetical protein
MATGQWATQVQPPPQTEPPHHPCEILPNVVENQRASPIPALVEFSSALLLFTIDKPKRYPQGCNLQRELVGLKRRLQEEDSTRIVASKIRAV